jgi:hypothetical protein
MTYMRVEKCVVLGEITWHDGSNWVVCHRLNRCSHRRAGSRGSEQFARANGGLSRTKSLEGKQSTDYLGKVIRAFVLVQGCLRQIYLSPAPLHHDCDFDIRRPALIPLHRMALCKDNEWFVCRNVALGIFPLGSRRIVSFYPKWSR